MRRLVILDDIFPLEISAFRYQEFVWYLKHFDHARVLSNGQGLRILEHSRSLPEEIDAFTARFPSFRDRVQSLAKNAGLNGSVDLIYFVFLGNALSFRDLLGAVPFVFTLYPGGSFYP